MSFEIPIERFLSQKNVESTEMSAPEELAVDQASPRNRQDQQHKHDLQLSATRLSAGPVDAIRARLSNDPSLSYKGIAFIVNSHQGIVKHILCQESSL
jgi:hypothetical protein